MSQQLDSVMLSNKSMQGAASVSAAGHAADNDQNMSGGGDPAQMMAQASQFLQVPTNAQNTGHAQQGDQRNFLSILN